MEKLHKEGMTIIYTTHYMEEAERLCDRIGIIDNGRIIENTSMKQLLSQLNVETFLLDLAGEHESIRLEYCHSTLLDPHTLQVEVDKNQGLNQVFTELTAQSIKVLSMRNKSNRLEALFVGLVEKGRK